MNTDMSLAKIDTSHWYTKDPAWVAKRSGLPMVFDYVNTQQRKGIPTPVYLKAFQRSLNFRVVVGTISSA